MKPPVLKEFGIAKMLHCRVRYFTNGAVIGSRLGLNPRDYFEDVLTRLPGMMASEAASLTPANWLAARSGKARRTAA